MIMIALCLGDLAARGEAAPQDTESLPPGPTHEIEEERDGCTNQGAPPPLLLSLTSDIGHVSANGEIARRPSYGRSRLAISCEG